MKFPLIIFFDMNLDLLAIYIHSEEIFLHCPKATSVLQKYFLDIWIFFSLFHVQTAQLKQHWARLQHGY
jgi:hypothetical protein